MERIVFATVAFLAVSLPACGSSNAAGKGAGDGGGVLGGGDGGGVLGGGDGGNVFGGGDGGLSGSGEGGLGSASTILGTVRDFKFWDGTSSTNPDFENPPYNIDQSGNASPGYLGSWDDPDIVESTLGSDGKPVYKNPNGTPDANGRVTLTTHGKTSFDMWFHDAPGQNLDVTYPLPLSQSQVNGMTQFGYDSNVSGVPYGFMAGSGFFPIDDGTAFGNPNKMTFGNQSLPTTSNPDPQGDPSASTHNYSFTFELHAVFTYKGGEVFDFRGDDDVFVFINSALVINLGGIHGPETANVSADTLGLTVGTTYPLDFFSVERHVTGSNILSTTTLALQSVPQ
jgi:fibro-slime domain-containing protein